MGQHVINDVTGSKIQQVNVFTILPPAKYNLDIEHLPSDEPGTLEQKLYQNGEQQ